MADQLAELSPDEKKEQRFQQWLSPPGVSFANAEAEKAYKERVTRFIKAFKIEKPDRVPVILPAQNFPAYYAGVDTHTVMYNYDELKRAWLKFLNDFEMDTYIPPVLVPPGRALEAVQYKLYKWPGHGLSTSVTTYQCVESDWMKPDEYDALIRDPSDFWLRTYLPRVFGALEPLSTIPAFTTIEEIATTSFLPFGTPGVQAALNAMMEAGNETMKWMEAVGEVMGYALASGYPGIMAGLAKAPFDTLGDTLRGTQGIMMDMFQRPDKLLEALERITPLSINSALATVNTSSTPIVFMPLHKGADGFMSEKQFLKFYWPTLKRVIMSLADEGVMVILFAEGSYNSRLDIVKELPKGAVAWYFDQTDMSRAKEILGRTACLIGNVPTSITANGTPQEVKEHCRKLIESCGKGGGYILAGGAMLDKGNPENMRAMMDAAKEYGKY